MTATREESAPDQKTRPPDLTLLFFHPSLLLPKAALTAGVDLPHDCKMGVCMTCPARVTAGTVDQSAGMLDDEVQEKGYALMCVATPLEDCAIRVIQEEELLDEVLQASKAASSG